MSKDRDGRHGRSNGGLRDTASRIEDQAQRHLKPLLHAMLRGGRITKYQGVVASYAPQLGLVEPVGESTPSAPHSPFQRVRDLLRWSAAPAALLALASAAPAQAQDACIEISTGNFTCQDLGAPATTTQDIDADGPNIQIEDGFEIDTSGTSGNALTVNSGPTAGVVITQIDGTSTLTGFDDGINVYNGGGGVVITTGGAVTGVAGRGIYVASNAYGSAVGGPTVIDTSAGTVTGGTYGIEIVDSGDDPLTLTVDDVIGQTLSGIRVSTDNAAADITVQSVSGAVSGATSGMSLITDGADITVDSFASVTGGVGDGINADSGGGDIAISNIGTILATGGYAIHANSSGGDISIQGVGLVGGVTSTGSDNGIQAQAGYGAINIGGITPIGNVTGGNSGIDARSDGGDVTIDTSGGMVTGVTAGIFAEASLTGAVSITVDQVYGANDGISVSMGDPNTDTVTIQGATAAATVSAGTNRAIYVYSPNGNVQISNFESVTSADDDAIYFYHYDAAADITITDIANAAGGDGAIHVAISNGDVSIQNVGVGDGNLIQGLGASAIYARVYDGNINIGGGTAVGNITGADTGIHAKAYYDNTVTIDSSSGTVIGQNQGILVDHAGTGQISVTVDDVTGTQGVATNAATGETVITLSSTADVVGTSGAGVNARSTGGIVTVQGSSGTITGATDGLNVRSGGAAITLQNLDSVTGLAGDGIDADSDGGNIAISSIGTILGTGGKGILARSDAGDISIQGVGLVGGVTGTGNHAGIYARSDGSIDIGGTVAIGDVTSGDQGDNVYGIDAFANGGDLTIDTSDGVVTGLVGGLFVGSSTGTTSITVDKVYGQVQGIAVFTGGTNANLTTIEGGTADATVSSGQFEAIRVYYSYIGDVLVRNFDSLTSTDADAVYFSNFGATASVTITDVANATGAISGLHAVLGDGDVSIQNVGVGDGNLIEGLGTSSNTMANPTASGIFARSDNGNVNIGGVTAVGNITGAVYGIRAQADYANAITIDSSAGTVTGGTSGIRASHSGTGNIAITVDDVEGAQGVVTDAVTGETMITLSSTADVVGTSGAGVNALSQGGLITVQGSSGTITGATDGIYTQSNGADITVQNLDSVTGQAGDGINATSGGGNIAISSIGTVLGTTGIGILAASGGGDISIQGVGLVGGVTGTGNNDGITAISGTGSIDIGGTTAIGNVTGGQSGIIAFAAGIGDVTIDTSGGAVTGQVAGLFAGAGTGEASITVDEVYGQSQGIVVRMDGGNTNMATIQGGTADAMVSSGTGEGIRVYSEDSDVEIRNFDSVASTGDDAIYLRNYSGTASLTITDIANATGGNSGIHVAITGGDISIQNVGVGDGNLIEGLLDTGIYARSYSGDVNIGSVTAVGNVTGANIGILAEAYGDSTITINSSAGTVTGGASGVRVSHYGTGNIAITVDDVTGSQGVVTDALAGETVITLSSTADVVGTSGAGVNVWSVGGLITVQGSSGAISGATNGVFLQSNGADITLQNLDSVTGLGGDGIDARSDGGDIAISSIGTILGTDGNGIFADSDGGDISIQGVGLVGGVTGTGNYYGIAAFAGNGSINIGGTTAIGNVTGTLYGIRALAYDDHAITIDSSGGTVTGGVSARHYGTGNISVTVDDVTGNQGVVTNALTGETMITLSSTADVVGTSGAGVNALSQNGIITVQGSSGNVTGATDGIYTQSNGADITVQNLDSVTGQAGDGIYARSDGGAIAINSIGTVLGTTGTGILAASGGGDISIQAVGLVGGVTGTGDNDGITAFAGTGSIDIGGMTAIGNVTGGQNGTDAYGIHAVADRDITIDTSGGLVTGPRAGIFADSANGAVSITVDQVSSAFNGIVANMRDANTNMATIEGATAAATVSVDAGEAITAYSPNSDVLIRNFESLTSSDSDAVNFYTYSGTASFTITDIANASGGSSGFRVRVDEGDISIQNVGNGDGNLIEGVGASGIYARANDGTVNIGGETAIGNVTGAVFGIRALAYEDHAITIDSSGGAVTGGTDSGIRASHSGTGDIAITVDDVTGSEGVFSEAQTGETAITLTATADIVGTSGSGILAESFGGAISVQGSSGTVAGSAHGVRLVSRGADITVQNLDSVSAQRGDGIGASSEGGDIVISNIGEITGNDGFGIRAVSQDGDISIQGVGLNGGVTGTGTTDTGIYAGTWAGAIDIGGTTAIGDVTSGHQGVHAVNGFTGSSITIDTSAGTVSGRTWGVNVTQVATAGGSTSITTADVDSSVNAGIFAYGAVTATTLDIDSSAGTVTGGYRGIEADHRGTGAVTITVNDVTGYGAEGIYASSIQSTADITVQGSSGDIVGVTHGIYMRTVGADIVVDNLDSVTGQAGQGIDAASAGGGITISDIGTILGTGGDGISAESGAGDISIQGVGQVGGVTGTGAAGINVFADDGGSIAIGTVTAIGDVTGAQDGIIAYANGGGDITIDSSSATITGGNSGFYVSNLDFGSVSITSAAVTGNNNDGIYAYVAGNNLSIDSTAGAVSGGTYGIFGRNFGSGTTSITTADVTGTAEAGILFETESTTSTVTIDTSAGTVTGGTQGIEVKHYGLGEVTITVNDVTGQNGQGIYAKSTKADADITVQGSSGNIVGTTDGIYLRTAGADIVVDNLDSVTGQAGDGLDLDTTYGGASGANILVSNITGAIEGRNAADADGIRARSGTGDITIRDIGSITGVDDGLDLATTGGAITVNAIGSVTGQTGDALHLVSDGGMISVTEIGTISGYNNGIFADADSGTISIQDVGLVGGITATNGAGIAAIADDGGSISIGTSGAIGLINDATYGVTGTSNNGGNILIDVRAFPVTGSNGVAAENLGAGYTTIFTAAVTGTNGDGISATNNGTTLAINAFGTVAGTNDGISAVNNGTGSTVIITADVTGTSGDGVNAISAGTGLTIDTSAGTVTGGDDGIYARNNGTGATTITTGAVDTRSTSGFNAIYAVNSATTTDLIIDTTAGLIESGSVGIRAENSGSGITRITTGDLLETGSYKGISVTARGSGLEIDTSAGTLTTIGDAIEAINEGGAATITTADISISPTGESGIDLFNRSGATDVTIDTTAGSISAGRFGIYVENLGSGFTSVEAANINSAGGGIDVRNYGTYVAVNTIAGTVTAGNGAGISVANNGTGSVSVTSADIDAGSSPGDEAAIFVENSGTSIDIDTSAGEIIGRSGGIKVDQDGSGDVTITVNDVTGNRAEGIRASSNQITANITVQGSSGNIVGATDGIYMRTAGADIVVDNLDSVTGQAGDGLDLASAGGAITVTDVDTILGTGGHGIVAYSGNGSISIQGSGLVGGITGTFGAGILAYASGTTGSASDGNIDIGGTTAIADVSGTSWGIRAETRIGSITIDSTTGVVSGNLAGIMARSRSQRGVTIATSSVTSASFGVGLSAYSAGGGVTIDSSAGTVTGGTIGIDATDTGAGDITVEVDDVTAGQGIVTNAGTGETVISLVATADINATSGNGINARSADGAVTIQGLGGLVPGRNITGRTDGIYSRTQGGDILVDNLDSVTGQAGQGIDAASGGGAITISDIGTILGTGGDGIIAESGGGNISIQGVGLIGGVTGTTSAGINVIADGGGSIGIGTVTAIGNVTGGQNGIIAYADGGGDITIDSSSGSVTGGGIGLYISNLGTGSLSITSAAATGDSYYGIYAYGAGTDLTIDSTAGAVTGGTIGIRGRQFGSGTVSITTADVTGTAGAGIYFETETDTSTVTIDTSAGTVTGGTQGIDVKHYGPGDVTITVNDVTGQTGQGISAASNKADADITIQGSSGNIVGGTDGIYTRTFGADITVDNLDSVTGQTDDGIDLASAGGAIAVTDIGTVLGTGANGIRAGSYGGSISIQGVGLVGGITGGNGSGILADAAGGLGGDINIGGITANGTITSTNAAGLEARTDGDGDVTVVVADVTTSGGLAMGILALGIDGDILVESSGTISTSGAYSEGVDAQSVSGGVTVQVADISTTGNDSEGIDAGSYYGAVTVTATGLISTEGDQSDGVEAYSLDGDIVVDVASISTAGDNASGIQAENDTGAIRITSTGTILTEGADSYGVSADTFAGDIAINVADVTTTGDRSTAVIATSDAGDIHVESLGTIAVSGTAATGVTADSDSGNVTVDVHNVEATGDPQNAGIFGFASGIFAVADDGDVAVTVTGTVSTDADFAQGVIASGADEATVEVNDVATQGEFASALLVTATDGPISIIANGSITTEGLTSAGINADANGAVTIEAVDVETLGTNSGAIYAYSYADDITVDTTGTISTRGGSSTAIDTYAYNGNITITSSGAVSTRGDGSNGISAQSPGGYIRITATGAVSTEGTGAIGVYAGTGGVGTIDVEIDDVTATNGTAVLTRAQNGRTLITLSSTADITSGTYAGIDALGGQYGDIIIQGSSGNVTGGTSGIITVTQGADITVQNLDSVTGLNGDGIDADSNGGDITISSIGTILGTGGYGILAASDSGDISIQGVGLVGGVTGTGAGAINVFANNGGSINIGDVTAIGNVTGAQYGITAYAFGGGDITIDTSGGVVTVAYAGIVAEADTGAVSITADDVTGGQGILTNAGTGETVITLVSTAEIEATSGYGIYAQSTDGAVTIQGTGGGGSVTGYYAGISSQTQGADITVQTLESVTGQAGDGIRVDSLGGAITITDIGTIAGTDGSGVVADSDGGVISIQGVGLVGGVTAAGNTDGIYASAGSGSINIGGTTAIGNVTGGFIGINAQADGDITIDASGALVTSGVTGIFAESETGAVSITVDEVYGGVTGIFARHTSYSNTNGLIIQSGTAGATVSARYADAINAYSVSGTVEIRDLHSVTSTEGNGIYFNGKYGSASVTISNIANATAGDDGIYAAANGGDISIQNVGVGDGNLIEGLSAGIDARSDTGDVNIGGVTAVGNITGADIGIRAEAGSDGDITIDSSAGKVTGGNTGIYATGIGAGDIVVTVDDVTADQGIGTNAGTGDTVITLVSTADINAISGSGINAQSTSGAVTIQGIGGGNITGRAEGGIYSRTQGGDVLVQNLDAVIGVGADGLDLASAGGDITVSNIGGVLGLGGNGLLIDSGGGDVSVQAIGTNDQIISAGNGDGIYVRSGDGAIDIGGMTAIGEINASGNGINAANGGNGTSITVNTSGGPVSALETGIHVYNYGSGDTTITTGDVTSQTYYGIYAGSSYGSITIDSTAGTVRGGTDGIFAQASFGNGAVSVTSADIVGAGAGIVLFSESDGGVTVDSTAGSVSGGTDGIIVEVYGYGGVSITTADVTSAVSGVAVSAYSAGGGVTIDSSAGVVTGSAYGIVVEDSGAGDISLTVGDVIGTGGGIRSRATDGSTDITLTSTALVQGAGGPGIIASSTGADADITIQGSSGDVIGATDGIYSRTAGADISITNLTSVVGEAGNALDLDTTNGGASGANIMVADISGAIEGRSAADADGIHARSGTGDIIIEDIGSITGVDNGLDLATTGGSITVNAIGSVTGQTGDALNLVSAGGTISVTEIGTINGYGNGIFADAGSGAISIQDVGLVGGITATTGAGIAAYADNGGNINIGTSGAIGLINGATYGVAGSSNNGGNIIIDVRDFPVTGAHGLAAENLGAGYTTIFTAAVTGTNGDGISATNTGTTLAINTFGTVTGSENGISAVNNGTGTTAITTAAVTGTTGTGIRATSATVGTGMTITSLSGSVSGYGDGIHAYHAGSGALRLDTANVTGTTRTGISATAASGSNGLMINSSAGAVEGDLTGLSARNHGAGVSVITTADVTGGNNAGIYAVSMGSELTIDTSAGTVRGGNDGIIALNIGLAGALSITTANVSGGSDAGIQAYSNGTNVEIDTTAGTVTGATDGISLDNQGSGASSITTAGITGTAGDGLLAISSGTDLTIATTGPVAGANDGISATNNGSGATRISATGPVTGTAGDGIAIVVGGTGGVVSLTTTDTVTGGTNGINVDAGTGDLTLNINGDVTGGDNGIVTYAENGTRLTVAVGQTITGSDFSIATRTQTGSDMSTDELAISGTVNGDIGTFEGDDIVTLADASIVNGGVLLGAGNDILNLDGGNFATLRGGEDTDILNFNVTGGLFSGSGTDTDDIAEFEIYNFNNGGYNLSGSHVGLVDTNFNAGENVWSGTLESASVTIASGAIVEVAQGASLVGDLTNDGALGINATGANAFTITGDFTQGADAILGLNVVDALTFDQLTVSGAVSLDGTLVLTQTEFEVGDVRLIDGGTALTGVFDNVTGLSGALIRQQIVYDTDNFDVLLVSTLNEIEATGLTDGDDISLATDISAGLSGGTFTQDLETLALGIGLIDNVPVLENALRELRPEISIAGLEVLRSSQNLFLNRLATGAATEPTQPVETAALNGRLYAPIPQKSGKQIWGHVQYARHVQDGTLSNPDFAADNFELAAGVSGIELGDVTFGFALGYSDIETKEQLAAPDRSKVEVFRAAAIASTSLNSSDRGLQAHVDGKLSFAAGTNSVDMNVSIPVIGFATAQSGEADVRYVGAGLRVTFDGFDDKAWLVKPHVMVAWDNVYQSGMTIGNGTSALVAEKGNFDRTTFGYGLTMNHQWTEKTRLHAALSGYHFVGDTQIGLGSTFASNSAATSFLTTGEDIRHQYVVESGIEHDFGQGWSLSADGFAEFGDLEAYGGMIKLKKRF